MKFNLVHIIPNHRMHGPNGYMEIIETVRWGLEQLGHSASYSRGTFSNQAINIIFGAHMLSEGTLQMLPTDSIVYNFEQMRGVPAQEIRSEIHLYAKKVQVWEYSMFNMDAWSDITTAYPVKAVPVGYAPILSRIARANEQNIDILFYGTPNSKRLGVFQALSSIGLTSVFLSGIYGPARDEIISRSKVVLNVNYLDDSRIFEVARVSYLMANKKAVVSLFDHNTAIEQDLVNGIKLSPAGSFMADCLRMVENRGEREALEQSGYEVITQRDIRPILEKALR